ncbi:MAG TPA: YciI family protein [Thermomicrobiales bacterium]|nr:YciI family protein [Thermomicrobiales bacterium]
MPTYIYQLKRTRASFPVDATPEELAIVADHWRRLRQLHAEGTVAYVGRCEDLAFAITVFTAESDEAANEVAFSDPCVPAGLMAAEVHPYRILLPEG